MNNNNGALSFRALMETRDFEQGRYTVESHIKEMTRMAEQEAKKFDFAFKRAGQAIATYLTFDAAKNMIGDLVKVRGEFQQMEIAFTTMLGSKAKADVFMREMVDFAATTPFDLKSTGAAAKQLLAYGSAAGSVTKELTMLGDVASGLSVPIGELVYLYGTLRTQGRAYAVDIRQFAGRGIPIYAELAKVLKVNKDEVNALVEAGKVGFPQVEQAFKNMTAAGGMFGGLMEAQSKSIPGKIERMKDAWDQMLNTIGKESEGVINGSIDALAALVENYEQVGRVLTGLVTTYGTYRAAVMIMSVIEAQNLKTNASANTSLMIQAKLKADNAVQTKILAASTAELLSVKAAELKAELEVQRANVSGLATKKQMELDNLRSVAASRAAAQAKVISIAQEIGATNTLVANKKLAIATETAFDARKRASAASSEFLAAKTNLETAARNGASTATLNQLRAEVSSLAIKRQRLSK